MMLRRENLTNFPPLKDPIMNPGAKKKNRPVKTRIVAAPVSSTHAISDSDDDEPTPSTSRGFSKHVMNSFLNNYFFHINCH